MAQTRNRRKMQTRVSVTCSAPEFFRADALIVGLCRDIKQVPAAFKAVDAEMAHALGAMLRLGDFSGKRNEICVLYGDNAAPYERLICVGLGEKDKVQIEHLRQALGTALRQADSLGAGKVAVALQQTLGAKLDAELFGQAMAESALHARFNDDHRRGEPSYPKAATNMKVVLLDADAADAKAMARGCKVGQNIGQAQLITRQIANQPGNEIYPQALAQEARKVARQYQLQCKVHSERDLIEKKMGGILAVGQGSARRPVMIELTHNGRKKSQPDVVVVGKAVTFDSGGLNLKPSGYINRMKFDKSGGCAVLGIMAAAAALKLPLKIVGLIPSAENMPSQMSYRPDDVVTTFSGKTVEIDNTDAEGRMLLCDALAYGAKMKPKAMLDLATLTGACVVALGKHYAGLFSNDDKVAEAVQAAGALAAEKVWRLPVGPEYVKQLQSDVADMKNVGGRDGGSCTAAAFLSEFVGDVPWAHIDIAGMADIDKAKPFQAPGGTGFGVRLVTEFLRRFK